jgi:Peptidase family M28
MPARLPLVVSTRFMAAQTNTVVEVGLQSLIESWVRQLALSIGERNDRDDECFARLSLARDMIADLLRAESSGPRVLPYRAGELSYANIELELAGRVPDAPTLIVGAHYDSARYAPGANDNGTGVACLLALARLLDPNALGRPVRLVAFANEEPPHTRKPSMGSLVYAQHLKDEHVQVRGMVSLETLAPLRSRVMALAQSPLFVVGNLRSLHLARRLRHELRVAGRPARLVAAPGFLPGVRSSDHWSFWKHGWPAAMLTAGGPLTYWHYHRPTDRVEHVELSHLASIARACCNAVTALSIEATIRSVAH